MKQLELEKIVICRSLLEDRIIKLFLQAAAKPDDSARLAEFTAALIAAAEELGLKGNILREYIIYLLAHDRNIAAETIEASGGSIGTSLKAAFCKDIENLLPIFTCPAHDFVAETILDDYTPTVIANTEASQSLLDSLQGAATAGQVAKAFLDYYQHYGYGELASFKAFRWQEGKLIGIRHFESFYMDDLIGYDHQKEQLIANTAAFVAGKPANNVLLAGARGTGKSSGVKALANEYYGQGLRLLQLIKPQLTQLPEIMEGLRKFASKKFIIFLDDLSFEESDAEYKYLKSAIEGGVGSRPENVLIYATSNRRHLIRESWRDRVEGQDELYRDDSINETVSLSDRFGLIIHYYAPDQNEYLAIIRHMLKKNGIQLSDEELRIQGLRWEMTHSGRSGRSAQQFVNYFLGQR